jgi:diphthamide biosynthesis methyltransferase
VCTQTAYKLLTNLLIFVQEKFYGREVILADREFVEQKAESFIESARNRNIAFLGIKLLTGIGLIIEVYGYISF